MMLFDTIVHSEPYNSMTDRLRQHVAVLQEHAYGPPDPAEASRLHDPALNAQSFFISDNERVVSYAGVLTKAISHRGQIYQVSGLSCVATEQDCRRRGLGRQVVAAASRYVERCNIDFGIFTCHAALVPLYAEAGSWNVAPDVVLLGSRDAGALTSTSLGVVVLMHLFSARAIASSEALSAGAIDLDLPPGQFW